MKIGYITLADSSLTAARKNKVEAEIEKVIAKVFIDAITFTPITVANEAKQIRAAIIRLCDEEKCPLVFVLGGSGPAAADIVPDVTLEVVDRKLPGFGEIMRYYSYERFKVSVLSRAEAGVRGKSLVIDLPSRSKPLKFCLHLLQEGIAEALEQIDGIKVTLRGDEIEVPIDKYLPFLKRLRPKPDPSGEKHPTF